MPMPTRIILDYFLHRDGVRFFTQRVAVAEPRALVVIAHGLGEHAGRYDHVMERFAREGVAAAAYDYRGHGRSGGPRGDVRRFAQWVDDLRTFVWAFRNEVGDGVPIYILGHSLGGLVALHFMASYGEADGVVVSSPAIGSMDAVPSWKRRLGGHAARIMPRLKVSAGIDPEYLSRDPAVAEAYRADPLVTTNVTLRAGREIIAVASDAMPLAYLIDRPILMLQGEGDRICSARATEVFYRNIAYPVKKLLLYDGAFHEPFNDVRREEIMDDVAAWVCRMAARNLSRPEGDMRMNRLRSGRDVVVAKETPLR